MVVRERSRRVVCILVSTVLVAGLVEVTGQEATAAPAPPRSDRHTVGAVADLVSARIAAAAQKQRVEVTQLEDEFSTTWANPDGTLTTEYSSEPVRVAAAGGWQPISTGLATTGDGSVRPGAHPLSPRFAAYADGSDGVSASVHGHAFAMTLVGAGHAKAHVVTGAGVEYPDVLSATTLRYDVQPGAVKESIVVRDASRSAWSFHVDADGLTPSTDPGGSLVFADSTGAPQVVIPAALAWDSSGIAGKREPATTSTHLAVSRAGGGWTVTVSVDPAWLHDPAVVFPVTVDPTVSYAPDSGTAFKADGTSCAISSCGLRVGNPDEAGKNNYWRTVFHVPYEHLNGRHVTGASLAVTVTAGTVNAYGIGTGNPVKLSTASANSYSGVGSQLATYPVGSSGTFSSATLTSTINSWTTTSKTGAKFMLTGWEQPGTYTFKQMTARMSLTYNSYPGTPAGRTVKPCSAQCASPVLTNTTTPKLTGGSSDPDGNTLRYDFEVWAGSSASPTTRVANGSSAFLSSGATATWTVPSGKLANGSTYEYRVRAFDGTDFGPWSSGWVVFTVDTSAPAAPVVSSTSWPSNAWSAPTSGTITWTEASTDVASYSYQLDAANWVSTSTRSATLTVSNNAEHTFRVKATDKAGNISAVAAYPFGVGTGGLTSPADQDRTQARVTLSATGPPAVPYVAYQWRRGSTAAWVNVPTGDVTTPGTATHPSSWPVAITDTWTWNVAATAGNTDGLIQARACLCTSTTDTTPTCQSTPVNVQLAAHAFGDSYATQQVGPGTVALLTGDYSISATDVSVPSYQGNLSVGRSFTTLSPAGERGDTAGVFGPGWTSALPGPDSGAASVTVSDQTANGYIALVDDDGSASVYQATSPVSTYPVRFTGLADAGADGSTLTKNSASQITLTDADGTKTVWTLTGSVWRVSQVIQTGSASTTTYTYNGAGLVTRILAPVPTGVSCTAPDATPGCRSLVLNYSTVTVGTQTLNRLASVHFVAYNPQTATMADLAVAAYDYDSSGRLADTYDPRIAPNLKTSYTYDANGRLLTVTPPGLASWTLLYDGTGRFSSLTRPGPSGQTATTTLVYDVPFTGAGAPIDLSGAAAANWGQDTDLPATATAVFDPVHIPAGTTPSAVTATDWPYANLTYLDANGRPVNTASYGVGTWQFGATRYDHKGNQAWSLTPGNRAQAITPTDDTDPLVAATPAPADRADLLATTSSYDPDSNLIDTFGPTHPIQLTDGTTIDGRTHTHTNYDEGAPTGGPFNLETSRVVSAWDGTDHDPSTTRTGYNPITTGDPSGWTLKQATSTTQQMGSAPSSSDLVKITRDNAAGQTIETRLPAATSTGTDPHTTVTTHYTATGTGPCVSPALAGLACSVGPATQPTTGHPLPVTTTTYNIYDQPLVATETTDSTVRTTTTTYDAAGRKTSSAVTVTPIADGGTPVPTVTYGYDQATGLPTTKSGSDGTTLTTGYDTLGRVATYRDASGNTSTTTYDIAGHVATLNDGKGTTTYTYDSGTEHRRLVTAQDLGVGPAPGTFTAAYDAAGAVTSVTYPNGLVATTSHDNAGRATSLSYTKDGNTWLTFTQDYDAHDRVVAQSSPATSQTFRYDPDNRLSGCRKITWFSGLGCLRFVL
jgi:YD repeat-containing protein